MKMRNLFLTCAAVVGISAAMAVTASAEVVTNNSYDKTLGTVSVATDLSDYTDQMTVIVIPAAAYTSGTILDSDIIYIDQDAAGNAIFQGMGLKNGTELPDGDYYIKVGGTNIDQDGIIVEKFTVTTTPVGPTYTLGDIDGEDGIDITDANLCLQHCAKLITLEGNAALAADVDLKDGVDITDANLILQYCAKLINEF